jgi:hypothetical protein
MMFTLVTLVMGPQLIIRTARPPLQAAPDCARPTATGTLLCMIGGPPPMRLLVVGALLHLFAGFFALRLSRLRADYRPIAVFLAGTAIADLALVALTLGASTALPSSPLTGLARVVGHIRQALYLVWPFGFAALFTAVFAGRAPRIIPVAYVVTIAALVLGYPTLRGETLRQVYLGIELAALVVALAAIIQWAWRRESPTLTHVVALLLLGTEIAALVGPWHRDIFAGWDMARTMFAFTYAAITCLQGSVAWKLSRSS